MKTNGIISRNTNMFLYAASNNTSDALIYNFGI